MKFSLVQQHQSEFVANYIAKTLMNDSSDLTHFETHAPLACIPSTKLANVAFDVVADAATHDLAPPRRHRW